MCSDGHRMSQAPSSPCARLDALRVPGPAHLSAGSGLIGRFLRAQFAIYVKSNSQKCPFFTTRHWQWRRMFNHISMSNYLIRVIARINREHRTGPGSVPPGEEAETGGGREGAWPPALASWRHRTTEAISISDRGSPRPPPGRERPPAPTWVPSPRAWLPGCPFGRFPGDRGH